METKETQQTRVPEPLHSSPCEVCGGDHTVDKCPEVDYSTRQCADCGRQQLEWSKEAQESLCPNCGWPLGR